MPDTLDIEHELYPTPAQRARLERQRQVAADVWRALSARPGLGRDRLRAVAGQVGWTDDLAGATLDDLAAAFGRAACAGPLPAGPPDVLRVAARPLSDHAVELGGLETPVAAPLFLLPHAARHAAAQWQAQFLGRLHAEQTELTRLAVLGDAAADARLLGHLARWDAPPAPPLPAPPCPVVRLTLLERPRLRWGPDPRLIWTFRVEDIAPPRQAGLIAADPGMRRLWTLRSARGVTRYDNPMPGRWRPPQAAAPPGTLRRRWDLDAARLRRQALLVTTCLRPVHDAALRELLDHPELAVEDLNLRGFERVRADYLAWAGWSGALIQHRYLLDVARLSRRLVVVPAHAGATRTCARCLTPRGVRFRGRQGRCRACGAALDRDDNAAENLYRLGQAGLR
ncbi:zinc ribbon domain-containing protein [Deinococcus aerophilus]|uniref:Cas12f1-like TNB domain-containing protein n=1 Tax=Deinococcus aerophilus TaxID=522488 RepID=A0ABQ2GX57_9DEIO|nr:zinc ribbon domain-containing protein [Deinococcus aerophilus]GGM16518.1 hypothetical protein GCM10010841_26070 [Deinococcus aerophilus]